MSDAERFGYLVRKIVGKRLTDAQLTGKEPERPGAFYERSETPGAWETGLFRGRPRGLGLIEA
jgi:hypothetical protein